MSLVSSASLPLTLRWQGAKCRRAKAKEDNHFYFLQGLKAAAAVSPHPAPVVGWYGAIPAWPLQPSSTGLLQLLQRLSGGTGVMFWHCLTQCLELVPHLPPSNYTAAEEEGAN